MVMVPVDCGMALVIFDAKMAPEMPAAAVALVAFWMMVVQVFPEASAQVYVGVVADRLSVDKRMMHKSPGSILTVGAQASEAIEEKERTLPLAALKPLFIIPDATTPTLGTEVPDERPGVGRDLLGCDN